MIGVNQSDTTFRYEAKRNLTHVKLTFDHPEDYTRAAMEAIYNKLSNSAQEAVSAFGLTMFFEMEGTEEEVRRKVAKILKDEVMPKFKGQTNRYSEYLEDEIKQDIAQIMLGKASVSQVAATRLFNEL